MGAPERSAFASLLRQGFGGQAAPAMRVSSLLLGKLEGFGFAHKMGGCVQTPGVAGAPQS